MRTLRRSEAGFTFAEVLLAMTLMLVVMTATLAIFSAMERGSRRNTRLNDEQLHARVATDTLMRRLRNLASPADPTSAAVLQQPLEKAQAQELIFRTVNSVGPATAANPQNIERYRYCLGPDKVLYAERETWTGATPALPTPGGCGPTDGWPGTREVVAQDVVNGTRPVFSYQVSPTPGTYSEQTSVSQASFPTGIAIRAELFIDPDTTHAPGETELTSRVFLRNQNRPPTVSFTLTPSGNKLILNGSDSEDPEGNALTYTWYDNGAVLAGPTTRSTYIFKGTAVAPATSKTHSIYLVVTDVGNLTATSATKTASCNQSTCS
jgi:type II secretory pathway component PulJ